jgi:hypothetical protein
MILIIPNKDSGDEVDVIFEKSWGGIIAIICKVYPYFSVLIIDY